MTPGKPAHPKRKSPRIRTIRYKEAVIELSGSHCHPREENLSKSAIRQESLSDCNFSCAHYSLPTPPGHISPTSCIRKGSDSSRWWLRRSPALSGSTGALAPPQQFIPSVRNKKKTREEQEFPTIKYYRIGG